MTDPLPLRRWVIDTNVMVSWVLRPRSVPAQAAQRALQLGRLLFSQQTHAELLSVMRRPKFDRYVALPQRVAFLVSLDHLIDWVTPTRAVHACRDVNDDKFLDVAVHGDADALITGDADLLDLHPFHGVPILTPQALLAELGSPDLLGAEPGPMRLVQEPPAPYRSRKAAKRQWLKA